MDQDSVHMVAASKVHMLKPKNGNAPPITQVVEGVETTIAPVTVEEKPQRRLELKTRRTLLMGFPNEHQMKFNSIKDTKSLLQKRGSAKLQEVKISSTRKAQEGTVPIESHTSLALVSCDRIEVKKPIVETSEAKANADKPKVERKNFGPLVIEDWISNSEDKAKSKSKIEKETVKPIFAKIKHMTGNMSYLTNYEEIDGGYVACGGKFDGKADEGFFVGYSLNSKAFRVFNNRTMIVEENLHISVDGKKVDEDQRQENECKDQEKEDNVNITNNVNVTGTNGVNVGAANTNNKLLSDQEDVDEEADMNNMYTTIQVSPTPTIRMHKNHPLYQ
nr:ribonuclease H-like domain-containing protein [Tanacetum cinerariifolium]